ncbi:hypothetical protein OAA_16070 [Vibrio cyclitrophicus 1F175]|nr:hypothetical protein [Vibrio cyclitrophicus]OED70690.1 hypothetical protein OAU_06730 [Vibrio cyclitrophicus ZF99]OEF35235.1 hypothetical protein OA7_12890 [Vibrio cyclitrophicus 1F53]OEF62987.1 hypothetical protein OAA_16070 [Vibrio cyclitrophicus 1F175]PME74371.1 hypothetical protein BCV31_02110 [Vibrio cyclitrophicus]
MYEEKSVIKAAEQLFLLCGKDFRIVIDTSHNPLNANLAKPLACFCPEPSFVLILLLVWLSSLDNGSLTCTMLDRIF